MPFSSPKARSTTIWKSLRNARAGSSFASSSRTHWTSTVLLSACSSFAETVDAYIERKLAEK